MTEPHNINGIIMILGVILGFTLLFWGARLERYIGYARNAGSFSLLGIFLASFLFQSNWLQEILQNQAGIAGLWQGITAASSALQIGIKITIALLGIILGVIMHVKAPRASAFIAILIIHLMLLGIPFIEGWFPYSFIPLPIGAAILALCLCILRNMYKETFNAVESAIFGGLLVSYLFSTFYYLPLSIFIAFAVILCLSGILLQIHSQKKREHNRRIMTGEEST